MAYISIARKWRPQTLTDVVGQPLVTQAISNAIKNKTLHPVYLLTGTRGVGKTTLARIIAKSINCEALQGTNPCLKCDTCVMIQEGRYADLYEIDAASRTKVEDTREILDQVSYLPQMGKKKVYLIDEVHMLSQHSFNALLKTLEEPPEHVQFILATTEPQKIPTTIKSRCIHFNLKPIGTADIASQVQKILEAEQIKFETEATHLIAEHAKGSMRDALTLLEQCISLSPSDINTVQVQSLINTIPNELIINLLTHIHAQDAQAIEQACAQHEQNNINFESLLSNIANELYKITIAQLTKSSKHPLSNLWDPGYIQVLYRMAIIGLNDLPFSPTPKIGASMCLMRMAVFTPELETKKKALS
ncbi:DNA polymerase III subunit gamma/tau [Candidatus Comchoanobacter bicostacola]|uniref:DNA polymerase III subunit gamma/tau n=1 Tax=Candidatus Comchoanobacter bicostacola TaxID=2919598 RepID=A0ABY5DMQ1_9GAMM|nr:DNA polymerase III subunit gamma/tau [Candidatus Comchoanobacter bicostacola]UTC24799.1 DNA polymerase III subunit gamma/tau [Candidatus Comchoanobacter bicostacola]